MLNDIDLRLLEIFCCIYEKKSLTEATKCLHTSQSTLSFHLKNLENQLGQKLFYRKGRRLVPTAMADKLYDYARELVEFKLRLIEDIRRLTGRDSGVVRIGASRDIGNSILPEILGEFFSKHSGNVNVELFVDNSAGVYSKVAKGEIDFGITGYIPQVTSLEFIPLYRNRVWCVSGPDMEDRVYSVEELRNIPIILREEGSGTRKSIEDTLSRHGINIRDMNLVATLNSSESIKGLLKYVPAVSFLPDLTLGGDDTLVRVKVLGLEPIFVSFHLVKNPASPLPPVGKDLMNFILTRIKTLF